MHTEVNSQLIACRDIPKVPCSMSISSTHTSSFLCCNSSTPPRSPCRRPYRPDIAYQMLLPSFVNTSGCWTRPALTDRLRNFHVIKDIPL